MLLQDHCRGQGGFQTVGSLAADNFPEGSQRFSATLPVVRERSQPAMDLLGSSVPLNDPPLLAGGGLPRRMWSYHGPTISHVAEAMPSVRARRNRQGQVPISANGSLGSEGAGNGGCHVDA